MNVPVTILIGAAVGFLGGAGIYFDRRVAGRHAIVAAGTLRGVLVALLIGFSLHEAGDWLSGSLYGLLYGGLSALVIVLAKGEGALHHARYIVPTALVGGVLTGWLVAWLAI